MSQATIDAPQAPAPPVLPEVLTLAEAAEYLRVSEADVVNLARKHELPGRKIGEQWRFHKQGLVNWLCVPETRDFWKTQFGALKEDPYMDEMLESIYKERGRPMTEDKDS